MATAFADVSFAGELDYRLSAGVGTSDNIRRTATDEIDETIATAGLQFSYDQQTAKLNADLVGDLAYYEYLDNTFDSELLGNLFANGVFSIVPERFVWSGIDQFGQVLRDPFVPSTAENRENINYASTGPDFYVGLGSQLRLRLGGRYSMTTYETSPFDSTSTSGQLSLIRVISNHRSLSFNADLKQTEYDDQALNADFDQTSAYVRYDAQGARTNLKIDAGYNQLKFDANDEEESGTLLSVEVSRRMSGSSTLFFRGGTEFSTAAGDFAREQGFSNVGIDSAAGRQSADPFTLDHASASYEYFRNRTGFGLTLAWADRDYHDNAPLNQTTNIVSAHVSRDLSTLASIDFTGTYMKVDYVAPSPSYREAGAGVTFNWRLSRGISLRATYDYADRTSDVATGEYTENRFMISIGWGRGEPRSTRLPPTFGVDSVVPTGN
jgi:hypothetical protein